MTDQDKDKRIAELEAQLSAATSAPAPTGDVRADAVAAQEATDALTPTPTQAELDAAKRGENPDGKGYKTRQAKAN